MLMCCMTKISNMFLVQYWRLETNSESFFDFIKRTIGQSLAIFNSWYLQFLNVLLTFSKKKKKKKKKKPWNIDIIGYLVNGAGC